jgi:predicted amino acid-binding ACT domain protein
LVAVKDDDGTTVKWRHAKKSEGLKWGLFCDKDNNEVKPQILVDGKLVVRWNTEWTKNKTRELLEAGHEWHEGVETTKKGKTTKKSRSSSKKKKSRAMSPYNAFFKARQSAIKSRLQSEASDGTTIQQKDVMKAVSEEWKTIKTDPTAFEEFQILSDIDKKRHHEELTIRMQAEIPEEEEEETVESEVKTEVKEVKVDVAEEVKTDEDGTEMEEDDISEKDLVYFPEDHQYHESRVINLKTREVYPMDDEGEIDTDSPIEGIKIKKMLITRYIKAGLRADIFLADDE